MQYALIELRVGSPPVAQRWRDGIILYSLVGSKCTKQIIPFNANFTSLSDRLGVHPALCTAPISTQLLYPTTRPSCKGLIADDQLLQINLQGIIEYTVN